MTNEEVGILFEALLDAVRPRLKESESLRRAVASLGQLLAEEAERAVTASAPQEAAPDTLPAEPVIQELPADSPSKQVLSLSDTRSRAYVPLAIGDAPPIQIPVSGTTEEIGRARIAGMEEAEPSVSDRSEEVSLERIVRRCRLKEESCRLYLRRRREPGEVLEERIKQVLDEARAITGCFLWVLFRQREQPEDAVVEQAQWCYAALAEAASAMMQVDAVGGPGARQRQEEAMQHLAEAHSALRVVINQTWLDKPDSDQIEAHWWLKRETDVRRVLVPRYMRLDDPADPRDMPKLIERIRMLSDEVSKAAERRKRIDRELSRIRYHVKKAHEGAGAGSEADCSRIAEAIRALAGLGVSPGDDRIAAELDTALIERFPTSLSDDRMVTAALVAARSYHAEPAKQESAERRWSDQVLRVREWLNGRSVVIVGGERRQEAIQRLKDAFGLEAVEWVALSEHGSSQPMRAPIQREETAMVLILVKLAGHLHVEDARRWASEAGKPFIMLTAGYNPEQVAEAIAQQAGRMLGMDATLA